MASLSERMFRKRLVPADVLTTNLNRCLTTFDLAMFSIGIMTSTTIYTLPGQVAITCSGSSVFLAFLVAGMLGLLNIFCYAEFGSKLPKAGAVYIFSYVVYGEIVAFVVAWCSVFHTLLLVVISCRNWSGAIDVLLNHAIRNGTMTALGHVTGDYYPDLLAAAYVAVAVIVTALGPQMSAKINKLLTTINMTIAVIILLASYYVADLNNWKQNNLSTFDLKEFTCSVSRCYLGFQSFIAVFAYCDEAKDPHKSLKRSVPFAWTIALIMFILMSISLSLMAPYETLDLAAPHSSAFIRIGMMPFAYLVSAATIVATGNNVLTGCFVTSRFIYTLTLDGLLFSCCSQVNTRTKTPIIATLSVGALAFVLTLFLDINDLLNLAVIDVLIFAALMAAAVLIVRYCPIEQCPFPLAVSNLDKLSTLSESKTERSLLITETKQIAEKIGRPRAFFETNKFLQFCIKISSPFSLPNVCIVTFSLLTCFVSILITLAEFIPMPMPHSWMYTATIGVFSTLTLFPVVILAMFENNNSLDQIQVF